MPVFTGLGWRRGSSDHPSRRCGTGSGPPADRGRCRSYARSAGAASRQDRWLHDPAYALVVHGRTTPLQLIGDAPIIVSPASRPGCRQSARRVDRRAAGTCSRLAGSRRCCAVGPSLRTPVEWNSLRASVADSTRLAINRISNFTSGTVLCHPAPDSCCPSNTPGPWSIVRTEGDGTTWRSERRFGL